MLNSRKESQLKYSAEKHSNLELDVWFPNLNICFEFQVCLRGREGGEGLKRKKRGRRGREGWGGRREEGRGEGRRGEKNVKLIYLRTTIIT